MASTMSSTPPAITHHVVIPMQRPDSAIRQRPRPARSAAILSIAIAVAYAGTYLLAVIASRLLGNEEYGVFAALLALLTVVTVPGLALQAVIARRCATRVVSLGEAISIGLVVGIGCAAVAMVTLPALGSFLHIGGVGGMAAALGATLPLTVLATIQGWLQGHERFGALANLVLLAGAAKLIGGLAPLLLGGGPGASLIGIAFLSTAVTVVAACSPRLCGPDRTGRRPEMHRSLPHIPWSEIGPAAVGFGGLLLMSNLDLLLGRHVLSGTLSGRYAAATVVAKVALWIPQGIALTVLPRMAHAHSRRAALRLSIAATAVIGLLGCAVMAGFGETAMRITFGPRYASVGSTAWVFALQGTALALTQLMIIADIAQARRGVAGLIIAFAAIETIAVLLLAPHTIAGLIAIATVAAVVLAGLAVWRTTRSVGGVVPALAVAD